MALNDVECIIKRKAKSGYSFRNQPGTLSVRSSQMPNEILRIEPTEAKSRVDEGKAIILDVVSPASRAKMRRQITGAIRIEPEEFAKRYKEQLPRDKQIIAYCT
jgi:hypothetical protein